MINDMIVEQLEREPEGVVMWSVSSPEMCKLCPKGSDIHNKNLRKSKSVSVLCVLAALPVRKRKPVLKYVTVLQELQHTKIQLCILAFSLLVKKTELEYKWT